MQVREDPCIFSLGEAVLEALDIFEKNQTSELIIISKSFTQEKTKI